MALHGYVPHDFGSGIIIPLLKDKLGNVNDLGNYRCITLIPVISKLFELVLLDIFTPFLNTDDLQFGFKKKVGCSNAIFLLTEIIDYFSSRDSSIFIAALDFNPRVPSIFSSTNLPRWRSIQTPHNGLP